MGLQASDISNRSSQIGGADMARRENINTTIRRMVKALQEQNKALEETNAELRKEIERQKEKSNG